MIREAQAFCASEQKVFQIVRTDQLGAAPGRMPSAEVQFMCLDKGDPEIARPKLRKDPDTIIETRIAQ